MEYLMYSMKFNATMGKKHPDENNRTIKDYIDVFAALPPPLEKPEKSSMAAGIFRAKGNQNFGARKYRDAAISYTVSLMHAPPNSESMATAYSNRSAAFYYLELYQECLTDIERALQLPHSKGIKKKMILRKKAAIAELKKKTPNTKDAKENDNDLKFAYGENAELPGASGGIKISHDSGKRFKLVADRSFNEGEILIMEKPYLIVPELNENPTFCYHCLKETLCLISCDRCNKQIYCSDECRSEAYLIYHRMECPIMNTLVAGNLIDPRTRVRQLRCLVVFTEQGRDLDELWFEEIDRSLGSSQLEFNGEKFLGNTRKAFLSLPMKDSKPNSEMLYEATYLVTLLKNNTDFFKSNVDVPIAAEMLINLNKSYASNYFQVPYIGQLRDKASAAYPIVSLATHSCDNNTIAYIAEDGRFIMRASNYIKPGDEILYNYRNSTFTIGVEGNKSEMNFLCKRFCEKCDKTWSHNINERRNNIDVGKKLRDELNENPYNINALWKILMFLYEEGERYQIQIQAIKDVLADAYSGCCNERERGRFLFLKLGIL